MTQPARALLLVLLATALCLAAAAGPSRSAGAPHAVVVELSSSALAATPGNGRRIRLEQRRFLSALAQELPEARVSWRYTHVINGVAVVLPAGEPVAQLLRLPGVRRVFESAVYRGSTASLDSTPAQIGAPALWPRGLGNGGKGIKIGIIDDGVDQTQRFFSARGFTMPMGFPKGQRAYTTAKVIVARSFPPPGVTRPGALVPFEPGESEHGTHVAGIAAGDAGTVPSPGRPPLSGVAPKAYLGNYRVLTVPTDADVGLDGNAPEIVAAIEAAVRDGMDVINLSIGEPEIEPSNDIVALALDGAAQAGVVPVVAAGNDRLEYGKGSISSPGTSEQAITVAAVTSNRSSRPNVLADFSSVGPTPLSLRLKPDVSAPGTAILSSFPDDEFELLSGTSMASPHVAGAAALLLRRHPAWTVQELKSALVSTAATAYSSGTKEAPPALGGGGVVSLGAADRPLIFTSPSSASLGLVRVGDAATTSIAVTDAGGGSGSWSVVVDTLEAPASARVTVPATMTVPGELTLSVSTALTARSGEVTGFIVLTRGTDRRRIPFWLYFERPALESLPVAALEQPGVYGSTTLGRRNAASSYRYPELPVGVGGQLRGPERLYQVSLLRPAANFGVVVLSRSSGVEVEPRILRGRDENALAGYAALPFALNPYLTTFGAPDLVAGAITPLAGDYTIVFDSPTKAGAGAFTFRYWLNDTRPPTARLLTPGVPKGRPIRIRVADTGSGIDPLTAVARIDGRFVDDVSVKGGVLTVATGSLRAGRHRLRAQISDFQESRNMENVGPILPNTRVLRATVVVR